MHKFSGHASDATARIESVQCVFLQGPLSLSPASKSAAISLPLVPDDAVNSKFLAPQLWLRLSHDPFTRSHDTGGDSGHVSKQTSVAALYACVKASPGDCEEKSCAQGRVNFLPLLELSRALLVVYFFQKRKTTKKTRQNRIHNCSFIWFSCHTDINIICTEKSSVTWIFIISWDILTRTTRLVAPQDLLVCY